jgi:hypothetical protein
MQMEFDFWKLLEIHFSRYIAWMMVL